MKILALHCDYIKFKALKKALKSAELTKEEQGEKHVEEPLVVLTAVEKSDSDKSVESYVKSIKDIAEQVKAKNLVLYPYAHLSSNLGSPDLAVEIMKQAEQELKKYGFNVLRAPFGFYKEFELKCKGHPLSELSRSLAPGKQQEDKEKEDYDIKKLLREFSKSKLDTSKLKENDHRILGQKLDLFSFNEVAPGMVFFHNKGLIIWNELIKYWREEHIKAGYEEIRTPQILDKKLWQISGHWEKYRDNIFLTKYESRDFAVKPMNCPGGMLVYKNSPKSYKDFPMRVAELGIVHRQELSGVLGGMFRVIQFTQDDAHIFCKDEKQVESEILSLMKLIDKIYRKFKVSYHLELSTRPEKRIGSDKQWDTAESILKNVLKKAKKKYKLNEGDGAFYGPKIDFHLEDSLGRTWQTATIQLDFAMPERFDLTYKDEKDEDKRPIMLHRTVLGGIERFYAILLEHLNGNFPLWLSPNQVKVLPLTDKNNKYAEKVFKELEDAGIRAEIDLRSETMGKKVRDAQIQKFNYMITIGDKEQKAKKIAVRSREGKVKFGVNLNNFIEDIKTEIEQRK
jgi:threonyl-tRNA synthetase